MIYCDEQETASLVPDYTAGGVAYFAALDTLIRGVPYSAGDKIDVKTWNRTQLLTHLGNGTIFPAVETSTDTGGTGGTGGYDSETFTWSGDLAVGSPDLRSYNITYSDRSITEVLVSLGMPCAGGPVQLDVLLDGASIFPSGSLLMYDGVSVSSFIPDVQMWPANSYLTVAVLAVGASTPGGDMTLTVGFQR